ncbi:hypothetical protein GE061_012278 [Apolygus lucorum]|uniref:Uncharacterized protein n=1 Tax=Apolygus lucorum TaxID=248454 RepID=A0A6A4JSU3_APOLU|nr:hypothetical protein GE061_012278 [Apolygus lucorum]
MSEYEIVKKSKLVLKGEKHGKKKKKKHQDKDKKKSSDSNAPVVDEDRVNHGEQISRKIGPCYATTI